MATFKKFQGANKADLVEQFNNWAYDQYNYGDEAFRIVDAMRGFGKYTISIWFEGEEYVDQSEQDEPVLSTQYSEFPVRDRTTYELSAPSSSSLLTYVLMLLLIAVLAIAAVTFLGDQINAIMSGATPRPT